jgi:hypothetical protein
VEASLLLCDAAQAVDGKLYVLGGGWSITGPQPTPSALAIKIAVPWDRANQRIPLRAALQTQDGTPVMAPTGPEETQPVEVNLELEVGRPPGLLPGTPLDAVVALNFPPIPLPAGSRFVWRLEIDGESKEHWQVPFSTRETPGGPAGHLRI